MTHVLRVLNELAFPDHALEFFICPEEIGDPFLFARPRRPRRDRSAQGTAVRPVCKNLLHNSSLAAPGKSRNHNQQSPVSHKASFLSAITKTQSGIESKFTEVL